jgi:hypothetical protein
MPDDRRAWHREGGACLFIVNLLRRGRTICSRETSVCRGAWGPPRICGAIRFAIAPYVPISLQSYVSRSPRSLASSYRGVRLRAHLPERIGMFARKGGAEPVRVRGHHYQVVRHQAIGPHQGPGLAAGPGHELNVAGIVIVTKKRPLATMAPLGYRVRVKRHNNCSRPGHLVTSL